MKLPKIKSEKKRKSILSTERDFRGDMSISDLSEGEQNNKEVDTGSPIISIKRTSVNIDDFDDNWYNFFYVNFRLVHLFRKGKFKKE